MRFLFLILCCLPYVSIAQQPMPDANTILVKGVTFMQVCQMLVDSGYTFEKKDNDVQLAITDFKTYKKSWNAAYKIKVTVKDSVATFTATFTAPYDQFLTQAARKTDPLWNNDPAYYMCNKKGKPLLKSMPIIPFTTLMSFVQAFNKEIIYEKR